MGKVLNSLASIGK